MVRRIKSSLFARRGSADDDDDNVDIGEADAWWAERDRIEHAPRPKKRGRDAREAEPEEPKAEDGGYDAYFATESLFEDPLEELPEEPERDLDPDSPFAKLGVTPVASWREICVRHRQLAKQLHPDRLTDPTEDEAALAAAQMSEINIAYSELKRIYRRVEA